MPRKESPQVLRAKPLQRVPWLIHGFSTRLGGYSGAYGGTALNLGFTKEDTRETVERNRDLFRRALSDGRRPAVAHPFVTLRQIHSDIIHFVEHVPPAPLAGDGLITDAPGLLLAVKTADCVPVLIADPQNRVVGAFHAGWRGTVKRIVEKGVGEMRRRFGSRPADLLAAIGPAIRGCCYEVGEEVREQFESQFSYASELFQEHRAHSDVVRERYPLLFMTARAPGHSELPTKILLDLAEANRRQLLDGGVCAANISTLDYCTACHSDLFFSYRVAKGPTGRMMAVIGTANSRV